MVRISRYITEMAGRQSPTVQHSAHSQAGRDEERREEEEAERQRKLRVAKQARGR